MQRYDYLVPRVGASLRIEWFKKYILDPMTFLYDYRDGNNIPNKIVYLYIRTYNSSTGLFLKAWFDCGSRMHKAEGRRSSYRNHPVVFDVAVKEGEIREYLMSLRPIMRGLEESSLCNFLKSFTGVNPVTWDEALEMVCGEASLLHTAFLSVRLLPLSYVQQHAPSHLYASVRNTHTLSWKPTQYLHDFNIQLPLHHPGRDDDGEIVKKLIKIYFLCYGRSLSSPMEYEGSSSSSINQ